MTLKGLEAETRHFRNSLDQLTNELGRIMVGQSATIENVICGLVAGGHILIEGAPGLGKTLLVRTLANAVSLTYSRVQFTPDLMPADITGTNIVTESDGQRAFRFQEGPVFTNVLLADEINRATPKTQSALLEAMQEGAVTVAGVRHPLPVPFSVLATQNPIEMEGTYPLPEAQLDRFLLKVVVPFPSHAELAEVLDRTTGSEEPQVKPLLDGPTLLDFRALAKEVIMAPAVRDRAAAIILQTHPNHPEAPDSVRRYVRYGASPRGAQALITSAKIRALRKGRAQVDFEDLQAMAPASLRHRLILNFEGEAEGINVDGILKDVLATA